MDEIVTEEFLQADRTGKSEMAPGSVQAKQEMSQQQQPARQFVLEFDDDRPRGNRGVLSPTGNKDFMAKAQMFADTVQKPPKMTVRRKKEITTPDELSDERYLQLEAERRAVISSSTVKKRDVTAQGSYTGRCFLFSKIF